MKSEDNSQNGRKHLQIISNKVSIFRIYKEFLQININTIKTTQPKGMANKHKKRY